MTDWRRMKESMNMRRLFTKPRKGNYEDIDTNDFFLTELIWSLNCVDKYSTDQGLVQAPRPNADRKKQKNRAKIRFCKKNFLNKFFFFIFLLVMPKYEG